MNRVMITLPDNLLHTTDEAAKRLGQNRSEFVRAAQSAGLDRDSVVLAQVILTVPKINVVRILGHFDQATMEAIDACLRVSLALD
ncbi:MAG: hypothetical protein MAG451_00487 [Anaerolineales bacterium]|nr:hypothetical protein [Anaerolineales bacterium]